MSDRTCSISGCDNPVRARTWCRTHYTRWFNHGDVMWEPPSALDRFEAKYHINVSGCWLWTASLNNRGYGWFSDGVRLLAHRWSYMHYVGPIPNGLELDHLCRNRHCVNPDHLEPVTASENVRRGKVSALRQRRTRCIHGHEMTPENTYTCKGIDHCRACGNRRNREFRARKAVR